MKMKIDQSFSTDLLVEYSSVLENIKFGVAAVLMFFGTDSNEPHMEKEGFITMIIIPDLLVLYIYSITIHSLLHIFPVIIP